MGIKKDALTQHISVAYTERLLYQPECKQSYCNIPGYCPYVQRTNVQLYNAVNQWLDRTNIEWMHVQYLDQTPFDQSVYGIN